jgi:PAS domain S-box-containing protein
MYQFIAILDAEGTVLEINQSALTAVGATRDQIVGRPFWETHWWTVSTELQEFLKGLIRRAAGGEFVRTELKHYGAGGQKELIDVDFSLKPVRGRSGKVEYLIPEGRDITEKKRAEAEIAGKNEEIRSLFEKLKEFDKLKTQFFANVSHELRTPLALILGPAEKWLSSTELAPKLRTDVETIQRNARILLRLVNDLLDISKLEAGKMTLTYVRMDLARLVRETTANFDAIAEERRIAYTTSTPESLLADIDPEKVRRVLLNILSNAFKFTPAEGKIRIALRAGEGDEDVEPGTAILEIADSGPGVSEELRERIFERFFQVEGGATRRVGGTGLGLSIAQEFAWLHGGTITVEEAPEGGALFRIRLPLVAPTSLVARQVDENVEAGLVVDHAVLTTAELEAGTPPPETGAGVTDARVADASRIEETSEEIAARSLVLVVEDNPEMNRFVAETLSTRYRVITALDGRTGLEKAMALKPDLIVSDVMMPRLSGDELVAALRRQSVMDRVPILLLTAKADEAVRVSLLRGGAQDYIQKPFSVEELKARVGAWITVSRARKALQEALSTSQLDVTALVTEVLARQRDLRATLEAVQLAKEEAERASRVKTDFLNLVSHELRTPLSTLSGQIQILELKKEHFPQEYRSSLTRLSKASDRLQTMLDSLLEYARLKSGRVTYAPEALDLERLVANVVDELVPRAEEKGLILTIKNPRPMPRIYSSTELLHLIMTNLIGNAIKFTEKGDIQVSLAHGEGMYTITVADTGLGIPEAQQSVIFEPFEQLAAVRHKHGPGFGLGLAIVKELVGILGGRLELRSEADRGSTFTVTLPGGGGG